MPDGFCKQCKEVTDFKFMEDFLGMKTWKCTVCGNRQVGDFNVRDRTENGL